MFLEIICKWLQAVNIWQPLSELLGVLQGRRSSLSLSGEDKLVKSMWKDHRGRMNNLSSYKWWQCSLESSQCSVVCSRIDVLPFCFMLSSLQHEEFPTTIKILWITVTSDQDLSLLFPDLLGRWDPTNSFYL